MTPEQVAASVGTDCKIVNEDRTRYDDYVVVSALPTDDPCVASIIVEPKLVYRF